MNPCLEQSNLIKSFKLCVSRFGTFLEEGFRCEKSRTHATIGRRNVFKLRNMLLFFRMKIAQILQFIVPNGWFSWWVGNPNIINRFLQQQKDVGFKIKYMPWKVKIKVVRNKTVGWYKNNSMTIMSLVIDMSYWFIGSSSINIDDLWLGWCFPT